MKTATFILQGLMVTIFTVVADQDLESEPSTDKALTTRSWYLRAGTSIFPGLKKEWVMLTTYLLFITLLCRSLMILILTSSSVSLYSYTCIGNTKSGSRGWIWRSWWGPTWRMLCYSSMLRSDDAYAHGPGTWQAGCLPWGSDSQYLHLNRCSLWTCWFKI